MTTIDTIMTELLVASSWRRQELLEAHERTYGSGFAQNLKAEMERKLEAARNGPDWTPYARPKRRHRQ